MRSSKRSNFGYSTFMGQGQIVSDQRIASGASLIRDLAETIWVRPKLICRDLPRVSFAPSIVLPSWAVSRGSGDPGRSVLDLRERTAP